MAAEYFAVAQQTINLNSPAVFTASIPCRRGYVYHEDETGIFILRGITNQCFATYQVTFNGNIAISEGGAVSPIALALAVNGEQRPANKSIVTPAAAGDFNNVTCTGIIRVPRGCCFSVAVEYVSGITGGTGTPTPTIDMLNGNLTISRIS